MKTVWPLTFLQPFLALGCASGPIDVSDETSEAGATASPSDESSTGEGFDIDAWVGGYHHENAFTLIGVEDERAIPPVGMSNFVIRRDLTATLSLESCEHEPTITDYVIEPIDTKTAYLWLPGTRESEWGGVSLTHLKVTQEDCNTIKTETLRPSGHMRELEWRRGNVCWIIHCEPSLSEHSYHILIDYCDGEGPVECEPEPEPEPD